MYNIIDKRLQEHSSFSGYASIFNVKDSQNDVILPKAFQVTLDQHFYSFNLLLEHNPHKIIGLARAEEDKRGLYVKGMIFLRMPGAFEAHNLISNLQVNHMSIGYSVIEFYYKNDARYIKKALLHEISIVSNPANNGAKIYNFTKNCNEAAKENY